MGEAQLEESPVGLTGCPCGRYHPPHGNPRRRKMRGPEPELGSRVLAAAWSGAAKKVAESGRSTFYDVDYSGDCKAPIPVAAHDAKGLQVTRWTRCRKCKPCLRAKRNYWGYAAMNMTKQAEAEGSRSWFGTFTLDADWHNELTARAMIASGEPAAAWWRETEVITFFCKKRKRVVSVPAFVCDERFRLVCDEFHKEVRKYFRRLRHALPEGVNFRYFLVYERHKTGVPHAHFILHEVGGQILKRTLRSMWPLGFFQAKLIGGRARNAPAPERAAWYAVKYLTKSRQARVKASPGYVPEKRSKTHRRSREA